MNWNFVDIHDACMNLGVDGLVLCFFVVSSENWIFWGVKVLVVGVWSSVSSRKMHIQAYRLLNEFKFFNGCSWCLVRILWAILNSMFTFFEFLKQFSNSYQTEGWNPHWLMFIPEMSGDTFYYSQHTLVTYFSYEVLER